MKLGLCAGVYLNRSLEEVFEICGQIGVECLEIYCGDPKPTKHIDIQAILSSDKAMQDYLDRFKRRGIHINAFSFGNNLVHPDPDVARGSWEIFKNAVLLCEKTGVEVLGVFSGTPGGCPNDRTPNWITCPWPDEYLAMSRYQWEDVLIPFWNKAAAFAQEHGLKKIGLEMHPGFTVYNPETLLRLRGHVGSIIGSYFDPSHLMWQGMDPALAILELEGTIFGAHAKDVYVNRDYIRRNGVNDAKHYGNVLKRSWTFRTVGYGHGEDTWRGVISALRCVGYDGAVNIEHEDILMSRDEGVKKAADFLRDILVREKPEQMWWAAAADN